MSYSLSFTKAVLVVIFIADKMERNQEEFLSTSEISKYLSIPKPTLVKILQGLNTANLIETREGKQGGIRLMKSPTKITVLEILEAVELRKTLFQTSFNIYAEGKRPSNAQKSIKNILEQAEDKMKLELSKKTIRDLQTEMDG